VTKGLAGIKLSGSIRQYGEYRLMKASTRNAKNSVIKSFTEKNGLKERAELGPDTPKGLEAPRSCTRARWTPAKAARISGSTKCRAKNRDRVGSLTEYPPHSHSTSCCPKYGTADKRLVITVAPQNDIWPHGSTYPRKAAAIVRKISTTPEAQALMLWYDLK
jgi:hypothetical protein